MHLHEIDIPQPIGKTAVSVEEAIVIANEIGYPVLVRPSYVLGGRAMEIVYQRRRTFYIIWKMRWKSIQITLF